MNTATVVGYDHKSRLRRITVRGHPPLGLILDRLHPLGWFNLTIYYSDEPQ